MIKLVLGIIMICIGILGGYLAKDGWDDIKKKNKTLPTQPFVAAPQTELVIEANITPQKVLDLYNKGNIPIKEINIFATKYLLDENLFKEKQIKIKDVNKVGGPIKTIDELEPSTGNVQVNLKQYPILHFFENPGEKDNTPMLTYYCFRITYRNGITGKKGATYKVASSYMDYPSFVDNHERTAIAGSWGDFLLELPKVIKEHQKKLFNENL
jgi:hypothetical protein